MQEVRSLLDPLFERFSVLPRHLTRDLGASRVRSDTVRSAEIYRPTRLERRLRATEAFATCHEFAAELGGAAVGYVFDHAIYKAPFNNSETPWHQDQAYTGHGRMLRTFHFWIPLQDATVNNGCMHFIPGSHARGFVEHATRADGHVREASTADAACAVACPIPVGGVTVHAPLTLHYTGPNRTADVRRAWILHFGPWGRLAKLHPSIILERLTSVLAGATR